MPRRNVLVSPSVMIIIMDFGFLVGSMEARKTIFGDLTATQKLFHLLMGLILRILPLFNLTNRLPDLIPQVGPILPEIYGSLEAILGISQELARPDIQVILGFTTLVALDGDL